MRTIRFLLEKEFRQIFRNRTILAVILVLPVMQLIVLPLAANYEVRNIQLAVTDHDHSAVSQRLLSKITASRYFQLSGYDASWADNMSLVEQDKADLALEIPAGFEKDLIRERHQELFIAVNAINGTKAGLGAAYLGAIIQDYNKELQAAWVGAGTVPEGAVIEPMPLNWYNPLMNYKVFMVPGILAVLVTMIGGFLSALNIVREKEAGTMEQINVTPIRKHHFILGKLIPFWILGNVVFTLGMLVAWLVYGIIPLGNLLLLYGFIGVYLLAVLGFGLLISTFCDTQQQAMFIMFFFMMIFILMGGLFTSVDSMPDWAKAVTRFNPVSYLVQVMRMVVLKGSSFRDIRLHLAVIAGFALLLNGLAVLNYRKTS